MSTKVVVRHFHEGNDANRQVRGKALYATYARIVDLDSGATVGWFDDKTGNSGVCEVWAYCTPKDVPSRKQGRAIALGRLQKQFPQQCAEADFGVFKNLKV